VCMVLSLLVSWEPHCFVACLLGATARAVVFALLVKVVLSLLDSTCFPAVAFVALDL